MTRLPDRRVPPIPPWTTLELLQREHNRIREQRAVGMAERKRMPEAWAAHLARRLSVDKSLESQVRPVDKSRNLQGQVLKVEEA